jgi:hypothetical protein
MDHPDALSGAEFEAGRPAQFDFKGLPGKPSAMQQLAGLHRAAGFV